MDHPQRPHLPARHHRLPRLTNWRHVRLTVARSPGLACSFGQGQVLNLCVTMSNVMVRPASVRSVSRSRSAEMATSGDFNGERTITAATGGTRL